MEVTMAMNVISGVLGSDDNVFRNKVVLITGSAQGIGKELANSFARRGATLALTDKNVEKLRATAEELQEGFGKVKWYALDVTRQDQILETRKKVHAELGPVDVLVNNAGVVFGGPFLDVPIEKHVFTFEVNTLAVVQMTHAFLQDLITRSRGWLINVASAAGYIGLPRGSTYASSKWAVIGFSESLRIELKLMGHENVSVTTVCPSFVDTGMFRGVKPPATTKMLDPGDLAEKVVKAAARGKPVVREPWLVKVAPALMGVLPLSLSEKVSALFGVTRSMESWKGHQSGNDE